MKIPVDPSIDPSMNRSLNAFQRCYFAWAVPLYARMPRPLAVEAERIDRWLYSRAGLRFWLFLLALVGVSAVGLVLAGMAWTVAVPAAVAAWLLILFIVLGAWIKPEGYTTPRLLRFVVGGLGLSYLGALFGFLIGYVVRHGGLDVEHLPQALAGALREATPWLILLMATLVLLNWGVAAVKRVRVEKEMQWLRLEQERDATARLLAEARLKLLQRQIQPHFIFNTLAAVQHWVDEGDPRAGPLLRALTSFLRGSTELLALEQTPFANEVETLRHYLSVMEARFGDRLHHVIEIGPGADDQPLPAGLLLTLVENAIEHGLAPALHGGTVTVRAAHDAQAWTLRVGDDGVGLARDWREGIGLGNCRERLMQLFGTRASFTLETLDGNTIAQVRIDSENRA